MKLTQKLACMAVLTAALTVSAEDKTSGSKDAPAKPKVTKSYQYDGGGIKVPAATADEPTISLSLEKASKHLEDGAAAWTKQKNCVACHTNGTYLFIRPTLTKSLGEPAKEIREFNVAQLKMLSDAGARKLRRSGTRPAQVVYIAAGLAEWDTHVSKKLSTETDQALRLMLELQKPDGSIHSLDCWPPFESSAYQEATMAAMAIATAPGWLKSLADVKEEVEEAKTVDEAKESGDDGKKEEDSKEDSEKSKRVINYKERVEKLKAYIRDTKPPHAYAQVLQFWTSLRMDGILTDGQKEEAILLIRKHQQDDGGWSIRTFSTPEAWGKGNRAAKIRAEADFEKPASDGHMTGLALIVLQEAGVSNDDKQLAAGLKWLKSNQRESGRWWTRSLNTDSWHFITYSGTAYALLALQNAVK